MRLSHWPAIVVLAIVVPLRAEPPDRIDLRSPRNRQQLVDRLARRDHAAQAAARALAERQGWAPRGVRDGSAFELMAIRDGRVYMLETANANAAISTAANLVRNTSPYLVDGAGVRLGVWDGGAALASHREFGTRLQVLDGASPIDHATHVAGTIGATGIDPLALGMAPAVSIDSYNWTADTAEMASRAMSYGGETGKIQISNHSYGYLSGWSWSFSPPRWYGTWGNRESEHFGLYESISAEWDSICHGAPYYLPFKAASNDRSDSAPAQGASFQYWNGAAWTVKSYDAATDPYPDNWNNGGYDTISFVGTAKNVMTVGAVNDAVSGGVRSLAAATMTSFSNWGPTDDGRIKPDIVANGVGLYSCTAGGSASYGSSSGTSMATPNAAGSAALLVQYYGRLLPGQYMRAATLKGLIIHTADDIGNPGPDYRNGWGLMNTQAAAEHIRAHAASPLAHRIVEAALDWTHPAAAYSFAWDGVSPIRATLCWTDPPASGLTGLNDPSPRLINDLDLRILAPDGSTVFSPYVLNRTQPTLNAATGDNTLDNVEQVRIAAPPAVGVYTVQVTHKGTLSGNEQAYSLLISGQSTAHPGAVDLDKSAYTCVDTIRVELRDGDLAGQGTHTVALTTSGGDAEAVALVETPPDSGVFVKTLATADGPPQTQDQTVQLADGQAVTVTYDDADNGAGQPAVVQDTAAADCRPPAISAVAISAVTGVEATVTFETDEAAVAHVRYGTACGLLDQTKSSTSPGTSHGIVLTGLLSTTQYFLAVEAIDAAGNTATDANGGECYSFTTTTRTDYFTEEFAAANDLSYQTLTLRPDASASLYRACRDPATAFPIDPAGGTPLALSDDSFATVNLSDGAQVSLYGTAFAAVYVGSNGYITFTDPDTTWQATLTNHFRRARIAGLFADLDPGSGGQVSWKQLADRTVVTFLNVPDYGGTGAVSFQIEMFYEGTIRITWLGTGFLSGIAGLSAGGGVPADYAPSDLTAYGTCLVAADFDQDADVDLADFALFQVCFNGPNQPPNLSGCADADLDGDADADLVDFAILQACFNGPNRPPACW